MGGKTSAASKRKWAAKSYDFIQVCVPKGMKEQIKKAADSLGLSVNAYIKEAIKEKMEREYELQKNQ